jgi:hypothetical protein
MLILAVMCVVGCIVFSLVFNINGISTVYVNYLINNLFLKFK